MRPLIAIAILLLVVMLFYCKQQIATMQYESIQGLWKAKQDFLDESGTENMTVFVNKKALMIVIISDGNVAFEKLADYKYSSPFFQTAGVVKHALKLKTETETAEDVIPNDLVMCINHATGMMQLEGKDGTVYFIGIRSHEDS